MPLVSVILVTHRDNPFLRPAIGSVLGQTCRDLELVLVDNGAGLSAAALGPAGADPRLRWVRLPANAGIPAGHNAGVAASTGRFIALLDHDDIARPRRLELQVARMESEPDLGLVSSLAERIDENGAVLGPEFSLLRRDEQIRYTPYAAPVVTPAYTGRREVFEQFPYRADFPLAADFDFLARAAERWPMAGVPEVLLQYRWHPAQTTQRSAASIEDQRAAVRLLTARRRAGRADGSVLAVRPPEGQIGTGAEICRGWSAQARSEGFPVLAAYQARRSFALDRTAGGLARALALGWRATVSAGKGQPLAAGRMFFTGPLRALGLRPG